MFLNLMDHQTEIWMSGLYNHPNISFSLRSHYDNPGHYSLLKIDLKNQPDEVDSSDNGFGNELTGIYAILRVIVMVMAISYYCSSFINIRQMLSVNF